MRSLNVNKRELNNRTSNKKQRFLNVKQMAKPKGLFFLVYEVGIDRNISGKLYND